MLASEQGGRGHVQALPVQRTTETLGRHVAALVLPAGGCLLGCDGRNALWGAVLGGYLFPRAAVRLGHVRRNPDQGAPMAVFPDALP
jgi:hypothetical protein